MRRAGGAFPLSRARALFAVDARSPSVNIASGMAEAQASLFADILNEYLYYYAAGNDQITAVFLNNILELVASKHGESQVPSPLLFTPSVD
jgi:hypothetical protein